MSTLKADLMITPQELMSESSTQGTNLGALATTGDGRYFRYALVGGTSLVPGKLYQGAAESTANWEALAITTASGVAGSTSLVLSSSVTLTANVLAGGYVAVTATPGLGYQYKIKANTAVSAAAGCVITLEDPVQVAITSSSYIDVIPSPYSKVELWDYSNHDSMPIGVAVYPVTNAYYGWVQVRGPVCMLADSGALGVGVNVYASAAVDGAGDATATYGFIGNAITGIAAAEYGMVNLSIS